MLMCELIFVYCELIWFFGFEWFLWFCVGDFGDFVIGYFNLLLVLFWFVNELLLVVCGEGEG